MKVLYVCADAGIPIGGTKGAAVHVEEVRRAFVRTGHQVDLLARTVARWPPGTVVEHVPAPSPALRRAAPWLDGILLGRACAAAIARHRPDFVYARYALGAPQPGEAARAAHVPFVLEVNAPLVEEAARFRGVPATSKALAAQQYEWRAADLVVTVSEPLAEAVKDTCQPHVLVAPNAVDATVFRPHDSVAARAALGLSGRFVVAFSGTVRPWHDLPVVLGALSALPRVLRPVLLVIGETGALPAAEGVEVVRTGPVAHDAVPLMLAAADVCLAPLAPGADLAYFSPLKALEYLACGRPTVVAAAAGLAPLAAAGVAESYVPGNAADLARVLQLLVMDPVHRAQLGLRGQAYAAARTWDDVVARVVAAVVALPYQAAPPPALKK